MKVRLEVVCLNADGDEQRRQVLTIERRELSGRLLRCDFAARFRGITDMSAMRRFSIP